MQGAHPVEPHPYDGAPSSSKRPSSPKVLGILSIIFGSLIGLYSLMLVAAGGVMGASFSELSLDDHPQHAAFKAMADNVTLLYTVQGLAFTIMSFWLLFLGIGQVRYKPWARRMSVTWGVIALVVLVGVAVLQFIIVPQMFQSMRELGPPGGAGMALGQTMAGATALVTVVLFAPYPIILIAMFRRPVVIAAMETGRL
jgi:hypothetical protein